MTQLPNRYGNDGWDSDNTVPAAYITMLLCTSIQFSAFAFCFDNIPLST